MSDKTSIRPTVATEPAETLAEQFQNQTLRPILKMQNELLIAIFKNYIHQRKDIFYKLSSGDKETYITKALKQDQKFQQFLKGVIIGNFTEKEYAVFSDNEQELSKRLASLLEQRLQSNLTML